MTFYLDDDEAREDWDVEREAFQRPADDDDGQLDLPFPLPTRFYLDDLQSLPVVRDRLRDSMIIGRFLTVAGAEHYMGLREAGVGHWPAMMANPEIEAIEKRGKAC